MTMWSLYWRLVGARIRSQMQYKVSFALDLVGFGLTTGLEFAIIAILLARFGTVAGWSIPDIALLYGLTSIAFSIAEMVGRGFDHPFEVMMVAGTFDSVLIRPLDSFFQVLSSEFQLRRLGRLFQGAAILLYGLRELDIDWTIDRLLLVPLTIASGSVIYTGLLVMGATICFWTIRTPEFINVFTSGGNSMVSFPLEIYTRWMRTLFIFIVPVAFVNYPTTLYLLGRESSAGLPAALAWASPLVAALFFGVALGLWRIGVTKYQSAGS